MQKSHTPGGYSYSSYDEYLCLKPPLMLWITCLYLSRALVLPIFSEVVSWTGSHTEGVMRGVFGLIALPAALPACLVLVALVSRSPARGPIVRWIWANGRLLLGLAAILDLAIPGALLLLGNNEAEQQQTLGRALSEGFDLYFLLFIACSRRLRDVFRSYPAPLPPAQPKPNQSESGSPSPDTRTEARP